MKRAFCFFLVVSVFVFSGCSGVKEAPVKEEFTSGIIIKALQFAPEDFTVEAQVQRSSKGELNITITSPEEIKGLTYSYLDKFCMSFNDYCCETECDYLPEFSFPQVIRNVLADFFQNAECADKSAEGCTYRGKSLSGEYIVSTDKDGNIKNISVEEINFECEFINNP